MPFGLKKKDAADGDLDGKKASLFGGRSKSHQGSSGTASSNNPYAAAPASADPYAAGNPYATGAPRAGGDPYANKPPTSSFGNMSLGADPGRGSRSTSPLPDRREKSPVPPGGYGGGAPRPANPSHGSGSGYGANPYGGGGGASRPGGYGGMGRSNSQDTLGTDVGRNALFGDAANRAAQTQGDPPPYGQDSSYGNSGGGGYGDPAEPERELTAEEQEEQDIEATRQEIRFIKQQDVASTRNARRVAEQAEQTGRDTLARLGAQGERIHNAERNLDMASSQNRAAAERAGELKSLNRSMFAVHVSNPFTSKRREETANAVALGKHQAERRQREDTHAQAVQSASRQQRQQRELPGGGPTGGPSKASLADRAKYQFEADSDDDAMEAELDDNLAAIHRGARTLNALGRAMGDEIDSQNRHIDRISGKTDKVDDQIAVNRARLDRIR